MARGVKKMIDQHEKLVTSMRYWLQGRKYYSALKAMEFARKIHCGLRKDGRTPEFDHQIRVAHYLRTLENGLLFPEICLCVSFLHDCPENYDISFREISEKFGDTVSIAVQKLTRKFKGEEIPDEIYYRGMKDCPIASIVKGGDRIHNFQSMPGVFNRAKQLLYIKECEEFIIPMIKEARRIFPEQEGAYENAKHLLQSQIDLIMKIHESVYGKNGIDFPPEGVVASSGVSLIGP